MPRTHEDAPIAGMPLSDIRIYLAADGEPVEHAEALLRSHLGAKADEAGLVPLDVCWRIFSEHSARVGDETHRVFGRGMKPGCTTLERRIIKNSVGIPDHTSIKRCPQRSILPP